MQERGGGRILNIKERKPKGLSLSSGHTQELERGAYLLFGRNWSSSLSGKA